MKNVKKWKMAFKYSAQEGWVRECYDDDSASFNFYYNIFLEIWAKSVPLRVKRVDLQNKNAREVGVHDCGGVHIEYEYFECENDLRWTMNFDNMLEIIFSRDRGTNVGFTGCVEVRTVDDAITSALLATVKLAI